MSVLRATVACAAGAAILLAAASVQACVRFTGSPINVTYDPFEGGDVIVPLSLHIAREDLDEDSDVRAVEFQLVDVDPSAILRIGSGGPRYVVEGPNGQVVVVREGSPVLRQTSSAEASFEGAGSRARGATARGLDLIMQSAQDVGAGVYTENLDIRYRCRAGGDDDDWDHGIKSAVLTVRVDVPSKISVNLAGGGRSGTIQFEEFQELVKTALVKVRSTGPYSLSIGSDDNESVLRLQGAPATAAVSGLPNAQIGYELSFNDQPMTLGAARSFSRTGTGGEDLPLRVEVQSVEQKRAGDYKDQIVLTFTPRAVL